MKKSLCLIPARGGSKRVPRKNILPLNGIPLISYTIRAAKLSGVFTDIIVSSDDEEIRNIALEEGVLVDNRPNFMAGDKVTKVEVVKEYIERNNSINKYDYVAALLPTCPFRTSDDIRSAFELLINQSVYKFLIGTTEYEFPIQLALKNTKENLVEMVFDGGYDTTRSQNIEKRYNMPAERSFDIDYTYQFEIAEIMARKILKNE